jgi:hypothetical protein
MRTVTCHPEVRVLCGPRDLPTRVTPVNDTVLYPANLFFLFLI